jgi:hypothetical protein
MSSVLFKIKFIPGEKRLLSVCQLDKITPFAAIELALWTWRKKRSMNMDMQHGLVDAACPCSCPCCFFIFMLHIHVHVHAAWTHSMYWDMQLRHEH